MGIITKVKLRISPVSSQLFKSYLFKHFEQGIEAIREIYQAGIHPATVRLSDEVETELLLFSTSSTATSSLKERLAKKIAKYFLEHRGFITHHRCLLILQLEGELSLIQNQMNRLSSICGKYDSVSLGKTPAHVWYESRYELPYMRENILQLGLLVDTLETACTYDNLINVYGSTIQVMKKFCSLAMAHVSHVYNEGASLYFTFMAKENFDWSQPKIQQIRDAVIRNFHHNNATISHHHGVGRAFRNHIKNERSEVSYSILKSIKKTLDPNSIMNPASGFLFEK